MDALKGIDDIAYIRFASVYRNFREAKDFHDVIDEITAGDSSSRTCQGRVSPMARLEQNALDHRYMAAAIRLSRTHQGLTGTNPSVATLIVKDGVIMGRGVTAIGDARMRKHKLCSKLARKPEAPQPT